VSQPKISVIIPVYNSEKYLKRCLDSVIYQTFKDLEIILIDDGSKDGSARICEEYKKMDNRIVLLRQPNRGQGFARNNGLKMATGMYISFVDSDDYIKLDMYEKLLGAIESTGAETCLFGFHRVNDGEIKHTRTNDISGTFKGREALDKIFLNILGTEPSCYNDFRISWHSPCLSLFSLGLIQEHNISFPSEGDFVGYKEDSLFNLDYYSHALNVTVLNEAFYYYCLNPNTTTTKYNENRFTLEVGLHKEMLRRTAEYIKDEDLFVRAEERLNRTFLAAVRNCVMHISAFFSYKDGRQRIKDMCNDPALQDVLSRYPWKKNPFKYRLFNYGFTKHMPGFLYYLGKLKKK